MPLVNCSECDKTISDRAAACPHCGAPTVTAESASKKAAAVKKYETEKRRINSAFAIAAVAVVGAIGAAYLAFGKRAQHEWTYDNYRSTAVHACEKAIKEIAHDPSSVEFPPPDKFQIISTEAGVWKLKVQARAKNGFGAVRVFDFGCVVAQMVPQSGGGVKYKASATQLP
ncbi:MAG: hypothetical protein WBC18_07925 [Ottowia sp.]|uniref:hypothetical protein n=1 Tax=Ottowia sp. TaxID=1898956 RepID=UPI003C76794D